MKQSSGPCSRSPCEASWFPSDRAAPALSALPGPQAALALGRPHSSWLKVLTQIGTNDPSLGSRGAVYRARNSSGCPGPWLPITTLEISAGSLGPGRRSSSPGCTYCLDPFSPHLSLDVTQTRLSRTCKPGAFFENVNDRTIPVRATPVTYRGDAAAPV